MGLFSKIFKGIKKVVKGVAKGIKKVVKGVAKVVKKVAKSKIFKAVLAAAAIYVTGGAAAGAFGSTGAWATSVSNFMASGTWAATAATPFAKLGTALGTGAGKFSDWAGWTTESGRLGAEAIKGAEAVAGAGDSLLAGGGENMTMIAGDGSVVDIYGNTVKTAAEVAAESGAIFDPATKIYTSEATSETVKAANILKKGPSWDKFTGRFTRGTILGDVARGVGTSVASGYLMDKINPAFEEGRKTGLDVEGPSYLDPLAVYKDDKLLSLDGIYEQLLYGNADPLTNGGNTNLYTQDIAPVPA